jgi:hypothetical protein
MQRGRKVAIPSDQATDSGRAARSAAECRGMPRSRARTRQHDQPHQHGGGHGRAPQRRRAHRPPPHRTWRGPHGGPDPKARLGPRKSGHLGPARSLTVGATERDRETTWPSGGEHRRSDLECAQRLAAEGKPFYYVQAGIHATEVGNSQARSRSRIVWRGFTAELVEDPFTADTTLLQQVKPAPVTMPAPPVKDGAYAIGPESYGVPVRVRPAEAGDSDVPCRGQVHRRRRTPTAESSCRAAG